MANRPVFFVLLAAGLAAVVLGVSTVPPNEETFEGRDPTAIELLRAVEAAFPRESYAPGERAPLVVWNRARGLKLQIFRSGPERVVTRTRRAP